MRQNNIFFIVVLIALMLTSCIKSYEPVIVSKDAVKYVVSGQVNQGDTVQRISISTTSTLKERRYIPVTGCTVKIVDDKGNSYTALENMDGNYEAAIPQGRLITGAAFKVDIRTPGGVNIVSDFDQINECPEVDSVYYIQNALPANSEEKYIEGLQFYLDFDGRNFACRNFRWEAIETWEYHAVYPLEWIYNGKVNHVVPPDFSKMICWRTELLKNTFTLTTKNLSQNTYNRYPLHFVDNYSSARLAYGYSLLIRQYALSEAAFAYWEKIQINSNQQGGLYEKQPQSVNGNLRNLTNPDHEVLGFFGAASVKSKRVFIRSVAGMVVKYEPPCTSRVIKGGLRAIPWSQFPVYLLGDHNGYQDVVLDKKCVDCELLGGSTVKPDFWSN